MRSSNRDVGFTFVACINQPDVAARYLLSSPCMSGAGHQLILAQGMGSAGDGFALGATMANHPWLVLVHQDVYLPEGWDEGFDKALSAACALDHTLAVVGVYGVQADGTHVGCVYDRDSWLGSPTEGALPVRSLDELLIAVRLDSGLAADPVLGWHLYGTDLCLQAEAKGLNSAVLYAPCEHHSSLPRDPGRVNGSALGKLQDVVKAFNCSAAELIGKWPDAWPLVTPIASIDVGFEYVLPVPKC